MNIKNIKIGDNVEIISAPRKYDNADAYAGYKGEIIDLSKRHMIIKGKNSTLGISDLSKVKIKRR